MSAKKAPGVGSPVPKRCAFVGHLRNAENTAAVIALFASMAVNSAEVSASAIHKQRPGRMWHPGHHQHLVAPGVVPICVSTVGDIGAQPKTR